ncbi:hypothetical protein VWY06_10385 [Phaeobacter sp. JH20_10]|uniref:hypothetical protein n=1 Tax=unclassified Phaeobacter TaxID=2621772 RepID=UPI003A87D981
MSYLRELENGTDFLTTVSRNYKNHHGIDELIMLPQCYWDYTDWLEQQGDISFDEWVNHCSQNPHEDWSLSHLLMYWLWMDMSIRHREGLPTPTSMPPEGHLLATIPVNDGLSNK